MEPTFDVFLPRERLFKEAIREWIKIELSNVYSFAGGISGADVFHVTANLSYPGVVRNSSEVDFVIKFSSRRTFKTESEKYDDLLSDDHKQYFINFSTMAKQVDDEFFMIMEHLEGFHTLEFLLYRIQSQPSTQKIIEKVISVLKLIQFGGSEEGRIANVGKTFRLYLGEIEHSISEALKEHKNILGDLYDQDLHVNEVEIKSLKESFAKVCRNSSEFEPRFVTLMHGDCHARNVLLNPTTLDLKFIDIDQLEKEGDYICDFGELLADLEAFGYILGTRRFSVVKDDPKTYHYSIDLPQAVKEGSNMIKEKLPILAKKDKDSWKKRLELAKARYLLSMIAKLNNYDVDRILATYLEAARIMHKIAHSLP